MHITLLKNKQIKPDIHLLLGSCIAFAKRENLTKIGKFSRVM